MPVPVNCPRTGTATIPGVPLFARGAEEVTRLTEMPADDTAARSSSRHALVTALLAIATGSVVTGTLAGAMFPAAPVTTVTQGVLAAAGYVVPARVERLLDPARSRTAVLFGLALALVSVAFFVIPVTGAALAG